MFKIGWRDSCAILNILKTIYFSKRESRCVSCSSTKLESRSHSVVLPTFQLQLLSIMGRNLRTKIKTLLAAKGIKQVLVFM